MQKLIETLFIMWNPYISVSKHNLKLIKNTEISITKKILTIESLFFSLVYITFTYTTDVKKYNFEIWEKYRLAFAGIILINLILYNFIFKNSNLFFRVACTINSISCSCLVSYSMSFGQKIRAEWIIFFSLIFLITGIRNAYLSICLLIIPVYLMRDFWILQHTDQVMITTTVMSLIFVLATQFLTKYWAEFRNLELEHRQFISKSIEEKIEYQRQIKKYIPQPLVKKIEYEISQGKSLIASLADIEKVRTNKVAIIYSDLINYSIISDCHEKLNEKLISPVRKYVDIMSENDAFIRTIGDGLFAFYDNEDYEISLIKAIYDSIKCCITESYINFESRESTRFFTVGYGDCKIGKIGGSNQHEITIHGTPANETNRIDRISHTDEFLKFSNNKLLILLSDNAANELLSFVDEIEITKLKFNISIKGFSSKNVNIFELTNKNMTLINKLFEINNLKSIQIDENKIWQINYKKILKIA